MCVRLCISVCVCVSFSLFSLSPASFIAVALAVCALACMRHVIGTWQRTRVLPSLDLRTRPLLLGLSSAPLLHSSRPFLSSLYRDHRSGISEPVQKITFFVSPINRDYGRLFAIQATCKRVLRKLFPTSELSVFPPFPPPLISNGLEMEWKCGKGQRRVVGDLRRSTEYIHVINKRRRIFQYRAGL